MPGLYYAEIFVDGECPSKYSTRNLRVVAKHIISWKYLNITEAKDSAGNIASLSVSITVPSITPLHQNRVILIITFSFTRQSV